jgi:hypothetical protein
MRDDIWLDQRLGQIWELLFPEVPRANNVVVRFKGKWKNKFGHIKRIDKNHTEIVVNGVFKDDFIPEFIVDLTLAHELVHYMHGFNSPLPQKYRHPHAGGVVTRELKNKGFGHLLVKEQLWIKNAWPDIIKRKFPKPVKKSFWRF